MRRRLLLPLLLVLLPAAALACFGTELRVGVGKERAEALYSYALGYFVEEKTGIAPYFVEAGGEENLFSEGKVDIIILPPANEPPKGSVKFDSGEPLPGNRAIYLRPDIRDDLRFTTLERALKIIGGFFSSERMTSAAGSSEDPKKAARKAVIDAE